jgi:hypothetical protein
VKQDGDFIIKIKVSSYGARVRVMVFNATYNNTETKYVK